MAVPIGTGEYVVMLAAFAVLGLALIIYFLQKWIREKFVLSVFEVFALSVIKFLIVRVGLLSFLLYLRWGLLPQILEAGNGSQKEYLIKVGDYLAVTWEMLYILSISILCTIVSLMFYKWRTISSGDYKIPLGWTISANIAVYLVSFVLIAIQYVYARDPDSTWEHVGYIWNAALLFMFSIATHMQADSIHKSVGRREVKNEETFELRKNAYIIKVASGINTVSLIVRAAAIAIDAFSFKFIPKGTGAQVLWNVFFKYVLWIAPEVISLIAMVIAMNFTEQLMYILAKIETKYKGGAEELDEVGQDEYKRVVSDDVEEETLENFMQRTGETAINENEAASSSHFVQVQ